jgi:hypothetical protein
MIDVFMGLFPLLLIFSFSPDMWGLLYIITSCCIGYSRKIAAHQTIFI